MKVKSDYHKTKLNNAKNSSDRWKYLRNIIGLDSKNKIPINTILSESGEEMSDKLEIANTFNKYIASVSPNTARSIHSSETSFDASMGTPLQNCFRFFE